MSAPPEVTTKAMSGKFALNKTLSDSTEEILRLQGMAWFLRRTVAMMSVTLVINHTTDKAGVEHVHIQQSLTGGIGSSEHRILDGNEHHENDSVFGYVTAKSRRVPIEEITDEFLKKDWTPDTIENDIILLDFWSTPSKSSQTWKAVQTWGFEMVNGERRYVRHTIFTSPGKDPIQARVVYDYIGPIKI